MPKFELSRFSSSLASSIEELNVRNLFKVKPRARCWLDATFQKRECVLYTPSPKDERRCCCGRAWAFHPGTSGSVPDASFNTGEPWTPPRNTIASPTDAYGVLEFQGGPHPSKAQYIRLAHDTRPELIVQLFQREWNVELPKLLITVHGGKANFELQPKLKKVLRKGLLKAAKTTGAWIFTGGTNTGVTRQVGDALLLERSQRSGRVISIGIAPWGIIENNHELLGKNRDVPYHSISSPRSRCEALNNKHAYFLLVDNGTTVKYGAEIIFRRKLEKYISHQKLHPYTHSSTPVVCLVIEGGTNTIRAVLEYVTDNPPVPVVVCDGSGRAADLIAFMHKYAAESEDEEQTVLVSMKEYLVGTIQRTFEVGIDQAECLYGELLQCTRKKNLITVFRITERSEGISQELDQTILTALFKSQHLSPSEQLSLALTWNRVDIARSEIFVYGQEWPPGALEEAMMQALEHDRIDFVKLLLENGVSMRKFLTIPRLEELYNTKQGPTNTLGYILRDLRPHIPRGYMYTLHDIGLVINKLMGGAYRAFYTRRKFRPIYAKVMNKSPYVHRNSASFVRYYGNAMSLLAGTLPTQKELSLFEYPFNELLIWAVLTKRQQMALLMWQHGEEALAKSLVACKLYKAMAHEAAEDDLETEIYEELRNYGKEFENIALELLDFCYRQDDDQAQQLLTCELQNWSGQTCLSLAVAANHRALLAHPCSQIILADLWMGGLRTRKNTNIKVILGLLCPVYIARLEFKSKEELQLMPQTQEEHLENESIEDDKQEDKSLDGEVLVTDNFIPRETIVQENGKVLTEADDKVVFPIEYYEVKPSNRPLRLKKKLYEFYTAPITKFWANSIAYIFFLFIFSYTVLVKMGETPSWAEYFAISYILALGCEKVREIISSEPVALIHKFSVWAWNMWNPCDAGAIIFFIVALALRLRPSTMDVGRVMYCVDSIYWYLRILNILGVNKYLGPLVTMMGKMVKNMIYFVVLLLVVLMSFGVCRQAILFPDEEPQWNLAKEVFYQPYFMLYGEVFADDIYPECGNNPGMDPCRTGRWITPAVMSMYLLVANILLINLLIAVFNNIFNEVNAVSHQVWMFQRFTVVMEYEQKPVLPPPLIILCHVFLLFKYLNRKIHGKSEPYDNGLKLFLEKEDMERLYDFEEECVEGYFVEKEYRLQQSSDERIKVTNDRVENIVQKVEDINTKENNQMVTMQSLEFRLRKLEEVEEQILNQLAVIHRFMATRITTTDDIITMIPPPSLLEEEHLRKSSDPTLTQTTSSSSSTTTIITTTAPPPSGNGSDNDVFQAPPPPRRRPTRSLTEVRPDAYIFDDGLSFEVRTVQEQDEEEETSLSKPRHKLNVIGERQRSTDSKTSVHTENSETSDTFSVSSGEITQLSVSIENRIRSATISGGPLRRSSSGRRSSEGGDSSGHGSGLHHGNSSGGLGPRRQLSLTHSEPDGGGGGGGGGGGAGGGGGGSESDIAINSSRVKFTEPRITVIPPGGGASAQSNRAMLLSMHTTYTSITDELESMCGLLSPPRTPRLLSPPRPGQIPPRRRHASEMSNPEMALYIEKEHLRNAEEDDYMLMENLIKRQYDDDDTDWPTGDSCSTSQNPTLLSVVRETREFRSSPRSLRRASAVDSDMPVFAVSVDSTLPHSSGNGGTTLLVPDATTLITAGTGSSSSSSNLRQDSGESAQTDSSHDETALLAHLPQRPSIIVDSSQLPTLQRETPIPKADSKASLHMQSETMC